MSSVWIIPESKIDKHLKSLEAIISQVVSVDVEARLVPEWSVAPVAIGLVGNGCEVATRNRGGDAHVAPLLEFGGGIWAWMGFYQEWEWERSSKKGGRCYSYRSTTLTIHFGFRNVGHKPQIFRAEWAGWAKWNGVTYGPQAGNAGHPHWQFDAVESLWPRETKEAAKEYLAVLKEEASAGEPRTFSPQAVQPSETNDLISSQDFSRMHFASVAPWWKVSPRDRHVHFPRSVSDVEAWVKGCIEYTLNELMRLQ